MQIVSSNFKGIFKSIWQIEKSVLETTDFNESVKQIVNIIFNQLGYANSGYEMIVLALLDKEKQVLKRVAISNTESAEKFLRSSPIPFNDIVIPLWAVQNLSIRAVNEKKMFITQNVSEVLVPAIDREWADNLQTALNLKSSIVFPIIAKDKILGTLILNLSKPADDISEDEWSVLESFVGAVGIALDNALLFKSLKDTTEKLTSANKRLEELDKLKDEFVSITSHELRTPMTVIQGYVWRILNDKNEKLSDVMKERLNRVYSSTQRLIALVNDMLDISRIESGAMQLKTSVFDMSKLSIEIKDELFDSFSKKNLRVEIGDGNYNVKADVDLVHQVLLNLIDNAIKFTPNGGNIQVSFKPNEKYLETSITDTGIGIKHEDLSKLFVKFVRLENAVAPVYHTSGTGLGLYLSRKIIELLGGKIEVDSEYGKGTKFTFSLPLAEG